MRLLEGGSRFDFFRYHFRISAHNISGMHSWQINPNSEECYTSSDISPLDSIENLQIVKALPSKDTVVQSRMLGMHNCNTLIADEYVF